MSRSRIIFIIIITMLLLGFIFLLSNKSTNNQSNTYEGKFYERDTNTIISDIIIEEVVFDEDFFDLILRTEESKTNLVFSADRVNNLDYKYENMADDYYIVANITEDVINGYVLFNNNALAYLLPREFEFEIYKVE